MLPVVLFNIDAFAESSRAFGEWCGNQNTFDSNIIEIGWAKIGWGLK